MDFQPGNMTMSNRIASGHEQPIFLIDVSMTGEPKGGDPALLFPDGATKGKLFWLLPLRVIIISEPARPRFVAGWGWD
jgi:hypothetical protein